MKPLAAGLTVDAVSVRYSGSGREHTVVAVNEVSLELDPGEVVAFVGPSGSGKSTLLRAIAGLEPLASGRVSVGERNLESVPAHARGVGMMFQDNALFAHLSVGDNIGYGLKVAGRSNDDQRRRVAELLDLVGLSGYEDRSVDQLSGGEGQRVALARALAPEPSVLLLDEPLGSLDRLLRDQLIDDLGRLLRDIGQTALYVTHDQDEAFALADRLAVLSGGRLRQIGPPDQLWREPRSGFVARFLGHPNVVELAGLGDHPVVASLRQQCGDQPVALIPVAAISPTEAVDARSGSLAVVVQSCRFNQGTYDVVADTDLAGLDRLVFRSIESIEPGENLVVSVDLDAVVGMAADAD